MVKIVAVSGGVDSVVLLHLLVQNGDSIIVAHVDHGIRDDSADDARFVRGLSQQYSLRYEEKQLKLGADASENLAREKRYEFLFALAKKYKAAIVTAHHGDDLAETIAINLHRGTGWRGLAVLNRQGVERPLLPYCKNDLYAYALKYRLEYVEDKTNRDKRYLRNRVRSALGARMTTEVRQRLGQLRDTQVNLSQVIAREEQVLIRAFGGSRHAFTVVDIETAVDLLGSMLHEKTGVRPVRSQLERALIAIKTAKPGTTYPVTRGVTLRFASRVFSVEMI